MKANTYRAFDLVADRLVAKGYAPLALNGKQPIATDQLRDSVWRHE